MRFWHFSVSNYAQQLFFTTHQDQMKNWKMKRLASLDLRKKIMHIESKMYSLCFDVKKITSPPPTVELKPISDELTTDDELCEATAARDNCAREVPLRFKF